MPASEKMTALARHAAAVRWQKPNIEDTARDLAAERIADYVSRVVATAPPLTPAQRDRIATLLQVGDAA
ncbi:hypothetical protein [Pseudolysinimonas sp.]